jgi:hypothetical protein
MAGRYALQMVAWLIGAGIGPALVGLPVNLAGEAGAGAAKRWFLRLRRKDGLSRLVRAAGGTSVDLTRGEFGAVRHLLEDEQTWHLAGRGTIEDLAALIASCLPPRGAGRLKTRTPRRGPSLAVCWSSLSPILNRICSSKYCSPVCSEWRRARQAHWMRLCLACTPISSPA